MDSNNLIPLVYWCPMDENRPLNVPTSSRFHKECLEKMKLMSKKQLEDLKERRKNAIF